MEEEQDKEDIPRRDPDKYDKLRTAKRAEILGFLGSEKYAGYQETYNGNIHEFVEKLRAKGIKVKNIKRLLDFRSRRTHIPTVGLGIGPIIVTEKHTHHAESTINHEAIHTEQYEENGPKILLQQRLGFIKFGIIQQEKIMNELRKERKQYGKRVARRYRINNAPMEYEAYLHEGDTHYLETRPTHAYKKYETKEGRKQAIQEEVFALDIQKRKEKITELQNMLTENKEITPEEVNIFNDIIEELLSDTQKIQDIKEKYKNDDWELISTFKTPQGPIVWLESETNRDKRLKLLDTLLIKEKKVLQEIKKYKNIQVISKEKDWMETGVIKIDVKDHTYKEMVQTLLSDEKIWELHPNIALDYGHEGTYIRIYFTG